MPSIINAATSGGLISIADTSGVLQLQTASTTALTINASQQVQVNTGGSASAPVISKSDDTNTGIFFPAADTIAFSEGGVESMRIDSSGILLIGRTSATNLGGGTGVQAYPAGYLYATVSSDAPAGFSRRDSNGALILFRRDTTTVGTVDVNTAGVTYTGTNGVQFTATQSASSDANTLDDYEEGTWEPDIRPATGSFTSVTYNGDTGGKYIKIGQMVYLTGTVRWTAITVGSGADSTYIGNLPFVCASRTDGDNADAPGVANTFVWNGGASNYPTSVRMNHSNSTLYTLTQNGNSIVDNITVSDIGSQGMITFAIVMYTNN